MAAKTCLAEPGTENPRKEVVRGHDRDVARIPVAVQSGLLGKRMEPLGSSGGLFPGNESGIDVSEDGHLQDARVAHLRAPGVTWRHPVRDGAENWAELE